MDRKEKFRSGYCEELLNHQSKRNSSFNQDHLTVAFSPEDLARLKQQDQEAVLDIVRIASEDRSDLEVEDNIKISKVLSSEGFLLPSLAKIQANPFSLKKEDFAKKNYHETTGSKYLWNFERAHKEIKAAWSVAAKEVEDSRLLYSLQKQLDEATEKAKSSDFLGAQIGMAKKNKNKPSDKSLPEAEEKDNTGEESSEGVPLPVAEVEDWGQRAAEIQEESNKPSSGTQGASPKMGDISDKQSPEASHDDSRSPSPLAEVLTVTTQMTKMTFLPETDKSLQTQPPRKIPDIPTDDSSLEEDSDKNVPLSFLQPGHKWKADEIIESTKKGRDFLSEGFGGEEDGAWGGLPTSDNVHHLSSMSSTYLELPESGANIKVPSEKIYQFALMDEEEDVMEDHFQKGKRGAKILKPRKKDLKNDQLVADYITAKELFNPIEIKHWDDPSLLPVMLHHSQILGISPAECYLQVTRIKSDEESKDALGFIQSHLMELKDRVVDLEEKVTAIGEKSKQKPQQVHEMIHPIRELVSHVAEIKRANATVVSGMSTLQQMLRTPRSLACVLPENSPSIPYEPLIKDAVVVKKQTVGRKPTDRPEDRVDLSKPIKNLTKLEKLQLMKKRDIKTSRDTSPGSGVESEKSYSSSAPGIKKKVNSIPDYSPSTSTHQMEPIPKNPLKQVEVSTIKPNKDIFKSAHFIKLSQAGIPIHSIEKGQALLQHLSVKSLDTLIKWLKEYAKSDWDSLREKMIESFSKKSGEELKAIQLYNVATFADNSEAALQYILALKGAKLALRGGGKQFLNF